MRDDDTTPGRRDFRDVPRCSRHRQARTETLHDYYYRMQFDETATNCKMCAFVARHSMPSKKSMARIVLVVYLMWLISDNLVEIIKWLE